MKKISSLKALDPYYALNDDLTTAINKQWFRTAARLKKEIKQVGGPPRLAVDDNDVDSDDDDYGARRRQRQQRDRSPSPPSPVRALGDADVADGVFSPSSSLTSSTLTTDGVEVSMSSSSPEPGKFSYSVKITNRSDRAVQLVGRRFTIQSTGESYQNVVSGSGVTNRRPVIDPGCSFSYVSNAPLSVTERGRESGVAARMKGA
eukprot:CAMPEP_0182464726 /NCGR_PEP_ID=MMETSP1319-20130603/8799_1 /TAXON_ID=172717 /ORGANISM="Bolidomonas pacifica, Strain RCC208" /LENGTH=203 /DNA_ID=CAMNT_0024664385 /DNA_START=397 /DNA_END=1005 /DNA_ORIENTATION=-